MKTNFKKIAFSALLFTALLITSSCSDDDSCNVSLLSFNNHLSYKVKVDIWEMALIATIEPGSSKTVEVDPNEIYHYTVKEYFSGDILIDDEVSVDDCVSLGIDIH